MGLVWILIIKEEGEFGSEGKSIVVLFSRMENCNGSYWNKGEIGNVYRRLKVVIKRFGMVGRGTEM